MLGLKGKVAFSEKKVPNSEMNEFYNIADLTISLSSEEGFGLSILESLQAGTPVICTKTGGMQDTSMDDETGEVFGYCIEPQATSIVGSLQTPYIYSHNVDPAVAARHIRYIYDEKERGDEAGDRNRHKDVFAGEAARENVLRRFNLEKIQSRMVEIIEEEIFKFKEKKNNRKINLIAI
jgi:glycosyltransferase involved in cell wall biosynthesis